MAKLFHVSDVPCIQQGYERGSVAYIEPRIEEAMNLPYYHVEAQHVSHYKNQKVKPMGGGVP